MSAPLTGVRVVVTRATHQAEELARPLRALDAEVILLPVIDIAAPQNPQPLAQAIEQINSYDWIIFTSTNGVRALGHHICRARIATVGAATREFAEQSGWTVTLTPETYVAEALVEALVGVRCRVNAFSFPARRSHARCRARRTYKARRRRRCRRSISQRHPRQCFRSGKHRIPASLPRLDHLRQFQRRRQPRFPSVHRNLAALQDRQHRSRHQQNDSPTRSQRYRGSRTTQHSRLSQRHRSNCRRQHRLTQLFRQFFWRKRRIQFQRFTHRPP